MQLLLDFSVTIRYVLPTRLQKADMQCRIIRFQCNISYVLPTRLQKAEMQCWIIRFQCNHQVCSTHEVTESRNAVIVRFQCNHQVCSTHEVTESRNAVIIRFYCKHQVIPMRLQSANAEQQILVQPLGNVSPQQESFLLGLNKYGFHEFHYKVIFVSNYMHNYITQKLSSNSSLVDEISR